jgi:hypothetical protein
MKYLIEFTVLFSVVIIYYLQLANKQDTTLGNLVYIPLIILSVKYPAAALIGLVCVILYNKQSVEGFDGSRIPSTSTTGNTSTSTSDPSTTTSTTSDSNSNEKYKKLSLSPPTLSSNNPNSDIINNVYSQMNSDVQSNFSNFINTIKQKKSDAKSSIMSQILDQCLGNSSNPTLQDCGIIDGDGNLQPPFNNGNSNQTNTTNNSITGLNPNAMLPVTNGNSNDVASQGGVNQNPDQIDNSRDMQQGLSDRQNSIINRNSTTSSDPQGSSTTETFSNIY